MPDESSAAAAAVGGAGGEDRPRTSVLMELTDRVGVLHDVLRYFWKFDVNVCRIESRPARTTNVIGQPRKFDFFVDFEGSLEEPSVRELMASLQTMTSKLLVLDEKQVHWFPRHISELDCVANRTLEAGTDLEADHPGFRDPTYRSRRAKLAAAAMRHRWDRPIPRIDYADEEVAVWTAVWDQMQELWSKYACKEYLASLQLMKEHCQYRRDNIPQQADINDYLLRRTGVRLRPVAGLLSSRDFLNGLAFRVFFCTQYIRHQSRPLYTPEPDICHELLGHVPMFADHDFADFSQEIGLASLGASDEDVDKLARCYWHSVEFGLCLEQGAPKAYGAGLLSSFGELEYACSPNHPGAESPPSIVAWDPAVAAKTAFPITTYQPTYFCAGSLQSAKDRMREYCQELPRPFYATWNPQTCSIHIDRPVRRTKGTAPPMTAEEPESSEASA
jgi:phenylalanine-4-hydroxylase